MPNQTPRIHRAAYFWPGLPQLWNRGSWAGLIVAVGFTALANVLLLATLVYGEWLARDTRLFGFGALAIVWLLARWQSRSERQALTASVDEGEQTDEEATEQPPDERDLLFREAQGHYLRNDWVAAEQQLLKLLKQDARDVESRLMLATLWRHQERNAEAERQLDRLERLEAAAEWQNEIAAERMALQASIEEVEEIADEEEPQVEEQSEARSDVPPERDDINSEEASKTEQRRAA